MTDVQPVIIDSVADTAQRLTGTTSVIVPPVTNEGYAGVYLNNGVAMYPMGISGTGAATYAPFTISRPHKLLKVEFMVLTSIGALDATSTNILIKRRKTNTVNVGGTALLTIFSTGGAQAVDSVVFVGGDQYTYSAINSYIIVSTIPNTDILYGYFYVQYL